MFRLLWIASIHIRAFMRRYMPSNIALDLVRTRRGLKWGPVAMLLAAPYAVAAYWLTVVIESGGPEWLYLLVLVCLWSALKMISIGPVSLINLARYRYTQWKTGRVFQQSQERHFNRIFPEFLTGGMRMIPIGLVSYPTGLCTGTE